LQQPRNPELAAEAAARRWRAKVEGDVSGRVDDMYAAFVELLPRIDANDRHVRRANPVGPQRS
jgi:hypothetical protein